MHTSLLLPSTQLESEVLLLWEQLQMQLHLQTAREPSAPPLPPCEQATVSYVACISRVSYWGWCLR